MTNKFECPYCGNEKTSYNGTGSDVYCCGEVGHAERVGTQPDDEVRVGPDFYVYDGGSIVLLCPRSELALDWVDEHLPPDAQRLGSNIAIERRYFGDIYTGIKTDGLSVA